eukprot:gene11238-23496_t
MIKNEIENYKKRKAEVDIQKRNETQSENVVVSENERNNLDVGLSSLRSSSTFATIGRRCGTDKVTHHGYNRFYPRFIDHYRALEGMSMLEIGIDQLYSLELWLEYFPKAFIYGVDIGVADEGPRHKIFQVDQSKSEQLEEMKRQIVHPVFFIIDDGSHVPEHQVSTFDRLFRDLLLPGGTYIVEDVETSYWTRNGLYGYKTRYGYRHSQSAVEIFKDLVDDVNREFLTPQNRDLQDKDLRGKFSSATRSAVSSITFGMNCIIIVKKTAEEKIAYDNRTYRFHDNL